MLGSKSFVMYYDILKETVVYLEDDNKEIVESFLVNQGYKIKLDTNGSHIYIDDTTEKDSQIIEASIQLLFA